jgi:hypothetical protein
LASVVAAGAAAASAVFWFLSAWVTVPAFETYWGGMPPTAPYQVAANAVARWNFWAAVFAAVAAACARIAKPAGTLMQGKKDDRPDDSRD